MRKVIGRLRRVERNVRMKVLVMVGFIFFLLSVFVRNFVFFLVIIGKFLIRIVVMMWNSGMNIRIVSVLIFMKKVFFFCFLVKCWYFFFIFWVFWGWLYLWLDWLWRGLVLLWKVLRLCICIWRCCWIGWLWGMRLCILVWRGLLLGWMCFL